MKTYEVNKELVMFNSFIQPINLGFNQFLLKGNEPVLIHTGSIDQTKVLLAKLKEVLNGQDLKYIFISHFESDECGGLEVLLSNYPDAIPITSMVTSRQLSGFGITDKALIKSHGDKLMLKEHNLEFISYPSEMHLWEGIMMFESKTGVLFSSDLFMRFGEIDQLIVETTLADELENLSPDQIPSAKKLDEMKDLFINMPIKFIVPGHGPVLKLI